MARFRHPSESTRRLALGVAAFIGTLLIFWLLLRIPGFAHFYQRLEAGFVRVGTGVGSGLTRLTRADTSLAMTYAACEDKSRELAMLAADSARLEHEVSELRALLNYTSSAEALGVAAHVIARTVDEDATKVLIDKGTVDGLTTGSAAVIDDGVLFGLVEAVRETSAVVRLVASTESNIPAAVLSQQRTIGLVEGNGGALLVMDFIPQDAELDRGNLVVTSGLDGLVREGLVIGLVTEVVSVASAPFQQAYIELLYEPREWTTLLIIPPPGV